MWAPSAFPAKGELTVVCIQQEGSHTTAISGAFHDIEHSTACKHLWGEKGECIGLFQIWIKEFRLKVFLIVLLYKCVPRKRNFHNFYSISEHFLLCELSGDCKQHSSRTCAVAGFGLSEALKCFYNVCLSYGWEKYLTEISHIQLDGTPKTQAVKFFACPMGLGGFGGISENWLVMFLWSTHF